MDETQVLAHPVVAIRVSAEAVTVDGEVVDRGSAGGPDTQVAMLLGVHAAARRVAQPLGRPVRAVLTCDDDDVKHLVVHPDGSVTDVEDTFPVVSLIAPPGARATPISWAARRPRRWRSWRLPIDGTRFAMGAAYVGLGIVLVSGFLMSITDDEPAAVAEGALEAPGRGNSPHDVVVGQVVHRLPGVSDVVADSAAGRLLLQVTTGRAAELTVLATPVQGGETRMWNLETAGAESRTVAFDGLEAGPYRWVVRADGETPRRGSVVVDPTPPPVVVVPETQAPTPDPTPEQPSPPPADDGGSDDDGGRGDAEVSGPSGPVDPDDPTAP